MGPLAHRNSGGRGQRFESSRARHRQEGPGQAVWPFVFPDAGRGTGAIRHRPGKGANAP